VQPRALRDALPDYLKPLFVTGYCTGVRLGELLEIRWNQVDWEQGFITLHAVRMRITGHRTDSTERRPRTRLTASFLDPPGRYR